MAEVMIIDRPEVVALIERAAAALRGGDKAELVSIAVRRLLDETAGARPLFGAHPGSVKVRSDVDLIQPVINPRTDAESGQEIRR